MYFYSGIAIAESTLITSQAPAFVSLSPPSICLEIFKIGHGRIINICPETIGTKDRSTA
jgi:hypothetical protein